MRDQRVLVTGGAGFIGSNVANHLARSNDVVALDDRSLGTPDNLDDAVRFVDASVLDDDWGVDPAFDVVVHMAARSSRGMLEDDPVDGTRVNVEGFVRTLERTRDHADAVVAASTSSMYDDDLPSRESEPVIADTCYDASMLARERYAEHYERFHDLPVAMLRFASVYQGYGGAESHKGGYANTISQWAAKLADGERPVLWGDGSQTRDYVHVSDVVRAVEAAADERLSGVYNVSYGHSVSFNETVAALNDTLGTAIEPRYEPIPLDHYNHQQRLDASKLRDATGWTATVDFDTGVDLVCAPYVDGLDPDPPLDPASAPDTAATAPVDDAGPDA